MEYHYDRFILFCFDLANRSIRKPDTARACLSKALPNSQILHSCPFKSIKCLLLSVPYFVLLIFIHCRVQSTIIIIIIINEYFNRITTLQHKYAVINVCLPSIL